ncbi:MAG: SMP-30/gluconolactonase/LRE family protein [Acetobacteraceae bacterium]|nr:SMP-30/gluconolactonase/LRE family protein [Acetobacteraceae bacterium]
MAGDADFGIFGRVVFRSGGQFLAGGSGAWDVALEYDGQPNGLAFHRDGSVYIADHAKGILKLNPASGVMGSVLSEFPGAKLKGPNNLMFAHNGDLYFTDQGNAGLHDFTGRLVRIRASGAVEVLVDNVPSPNGLVVQPDGWAVFLSVTRDNAIWYMPLLGDRQEEVGRVGRFVLLVGGARGPDGLAMDAAGNLVIAHVMLGSIWVFPILKEPIYRLRSPGGPLITNAAIGGVDGKTLYVTE